MSRQGTIRSSGGGDGLGGGELGRLVVSGARGRLGLPARGRTALLPVRGAFAVLLVVFVAVCVLAVSAAACEGVGGPPTEPTKPEQKGSGPNPASPKVPRCTEGDPVNCATGDETEQQTDLSIGGRGPGLQVVRSYDALAAAEAKEAGVWGYGWTGPYDASLEVGSATVTVNQENGSAVVFYKSGESYTQGGWVEARLVKEGSNYVYTLPEQSKLEFNSEGKLVKETERNGNSNTLMYNGSKQLEKVTDGAGRTLTFKYNGEGLVESVTDPMKHVVSYTYSSKQLASVTIEGKVQWEFEYTSPHLLSKITDGRKHATTFEYNASHQVVKEVHAGHERKWKYGTDETTQTEPNGSETLETFNAAGEPTKETRAKGKSEETTTEYEYNAETYNRVKMIDPNKHEWTYGYDGEGNKTSEKDPNGDEQKWEYDTHHDVVKETTPEGETTTIKRNEHGEPEVIERPVGSEAQKTEYKYGSKGEVTEEINPLGRTTKYEYDEYGDKKLEKDPEGDERKWKYNEDSQETEETSPRGYTTKTERDERGLPVKITDPLGHTTEYKYDGDQNIESETDGNGHTTKYEYNEENLPTKVEEPNKDTTETEYDSEGKMVARIDGNGHKWEYKRNALEQVTEEKNPLGKIWKKTYEKAGRLEKLEDPEKHTTEYTYDESGRLKKIKYSTGKPSEVTFEYNKDSKVTKMIDETGTTENTWDKLDRLTKYKNGAGKTVEYEYNLENQPTKITYPNGKAVERGYDKDGRLEKVTDWLANTTKFAYDPDSLLEKTSFPTKKPVEDEYTYNEADQLTKIKYIRETDTLGSLNYTLDKDGQVEKITSSGFPGGEDYEYKYDENNRLLRSKGTSSTVEYEYDPANNPTKIGATTYTYNNADEIEKSSEAAYAYSEDGQRTKTTPTSGPATTYEYNQAGNLTGLERPKEGSTTEIKDTFTYDGTNLRQGQTINGTDTNLTWDTAETTPIVLSDETNSYIYGPENLPIEQISSSGTVRYLQHDQQGSTRMLLNTEGVDEATITYGPYGNITSTGNGTTDPLGYDAQYTTNPDTGGELIYLRARTYDPNTAQFLSVDAAVEETGEPYTYADDNPENETDLTGRCALVPPPGKCAELATAEFDALNAAKEWLKIADTRDKEAFWIEVILWYPWLGDIPGSAARLKREAKKLRSIAANARKEDVDQRWAAWNIYKERIKLGCPAPFRLPSDFGTFPSIYRLNG
jgi:RHS repeat-associated protein